eukprot:TRINITY_DN2422_c2_g1_i4.p1 TRINITY_DN2422_c2_g1~~TRINITY_DN2422_c2_g1_i4.p1  ORF type:complete len:2065 (+),score=515.27 TRINITY_DN2422_c2_g1_i4:252-6197(+)
MSYHQPSASPSSSSSSGSSRSLSSSTSSRSSPQYEALTYPPPPTHQNTSPASTPKFSHTSYHALLPSTTRPSPSSSLSSSSPYHDTQRRSPPRSSSSAQASSYRLHPTNQEAQDYSQDEDMDIDNDSTYPSSSYTRHPFSSPYSPPPPPPPPPAFVPPPPPPTQSPQNSLFRTYSVALRDKASPTAMDKAASSSRVTESTSPIPLPAHINKARPVKINRANKTSTPTTTPATTAITAPTKELGLSSLLSNQPALPATLPPFIPTVAPTRARSVSPPPRTISPPTVSPIVPPLSTILAPPPPPTQSLSFAPISTSLPVPSSSLSLSSSLKQKKPSIKSSASLSEPNAPKPLRAPIVISKDPSLVISLDSEDEPEDEQPTITTTSMAQPLVTPSATQILPTSTTVTPTITSSSSTSLSSLSATASAAPSKPSKSAKDRPLNGVSSGPPANPPSQIQLLKAAIAQREKARKNSTLTAAAKKKKTTPTKQPRLLSPRLSSSSSSHKASSTVAPSSAPPTMTSLKDTSSPRVEQNNNDNNNDDVPTTQDNNKADEITSLETEALALEAEVLELQRQPPPPVVTPAAPSPASDPSIVALEAMLQELRSRVAEAESKLQSIKSSSSSSSAPSPAEIQQKREQEEREELARQKASEAAALRQRIATLKKADKRGAPQQAAPLPNKASKPSSGAIEELPDADEDDEDGDGDDDDEEEEEYGAEGPSSSIGSRKTTLALTDAFLDSLSSLVPSSSSTPIVAHSTPTPTTQQQTFAPSAIAKPPSIAAANQVDASKLADLRAAAMQSQKKRADPTSTAITKPTATATTSVTTTATINKKHPPQRTSSTAAPAGPVRTQTAPPALMKAPSVLKEASPHPVVIEAPPSHLSGVSLDIYMAAIQCVAPHAYTLPYFSVLPYPHIDALASSSSSLQPPSSLSSSAVSSSSSSSSSSSIPSYSSPLSYFKSFRLHPSYTRVYQLKPSSLAYSNKMDPMRLLCRYEMHGECNNDKCPYIHKRQYSLSSEELLQDLATYAYPQDKAKTAKVLKSLLKSIHVLSADQVGQEMVLAVRGVGPNYIRLTKRKDRPRPPPAPSSRPDKAATKKKAKRKAAKRTKVAPAAAPSKEEGGRKRAFDFMDASDSSDSEDDDEDGREDAEDDQEGGFLRLYDRPLTPMGAVGQASDSKSLSRPDMEADNVLNGTEAPTGHDGYDEYSSSDEENDDVVPRVRYHTMMGTTHESDKVEDIEAQASHIARTRPHDVGMWVDLALRTLGELPTAASVTQCLTLIKHALETNERSITLWMMYFTLLQRHMRQPAVVPAADMDSSTSTTTAAVVDASIEDMLALYEEALEFNPSSYTLLHLYMHASPSLRQKLEVCSRAVKTLSVGGSSSSQAVLDFLLHAVRLLLDSGHSTQAVATLKAICFDADPPSTLPACTLSFKECRTAAQKLLPAHYAHLVLSYCQLVTLGTLPEDGAANSNSGVRPYLIPWHAMPHDDATPARMQAVRDSLDAALMALEARDLDPDMGSGSSDQDGVLQLWVHAALLEVYVGDHEAALAVVQDALRACQNESQLWTLYCFLLRIQNQYSVAEATFQKLLQRMPCAWAVIVQHVAWDASSNGWDHAKFLIDTVLARWSDSMSSREILRTLLGEDTHLSHPLLHPVPSEYKHDVFLWLILILYEFSCAHCQPNQSIVVASSEVSSAFRSALTMMSCHEDRERMWIEYMHYHKNIQSGGQTLSSLVDQAIADVPPSQRFVHMVTSYADQKDPVRGSSGALAMRSSNSSVVFAHEVRQDGQMALVPSIATRMSGLLPPSLLPRDDFSFATEMFLIFLSTLPSIKWGLFLEKILLIMPNNGRLRTHAAEYEQKRGNIRKAIAILRGAKGELRDNPRYRLLRRRRIAFTFPFLFFLCFFLLFLPFSISISFRYWHTLVSLEEVCDGKVVPILAEAVKQCPMRADLWARWHAAVVGKQSTAADTMSTVKDIEAAANSRGIHLSL